MINKQFKRIIVDDQSFNFIMSDSTDSNSIMYVKMEFETVQSIFVQFLINNLTKVE